MQDGSEYDRNKRRRVNLGLGDQLRPQAGGSGLPLQALEASNEELRSLIYRQRLLTGLGPNVPTGNLSRTNEVTSYLGSGASTMNALKATRLLQSNMGASSHRQAPALETVRYLQNGSQQASSTSAYSSLLDDASHRRTAALGASAGAAASILPDLSSLSDAELAHAIRMEQAFQEKAAIAAAATASSARSSHLDLSDSSHGLGGSARDPLLVNRYMQDLSAAPPIAGDERSILGAQETNRSSLLAAARMPSDRALESDVNAQVVNPSDLLRGSAYAADNANQNFHFHLARLRQERARELEAAGVLGPSASADPSTLLRLQLSSGTHSEWQAAYNNAGAPSSAGINLHSKSELLFLLGQQGKAGLSGMHSKHPGASKPDNGIAGGATSVANMFGISVPGITPPATTDASFPVAGDRKRPADAITKASGGREPIHLYMSCDDDDLSPYQCLVRKQIELFEAEEVDAESNARGRNRPIVVGQVGIRCKHCKVLPPRKRERAAIYYPSKLDRLYQAGQTMASVHLGQYCNHIPEDLRKELAQLREGKSAALAGKKYWSDGARALGVTEDDGRLFFSKD